MAATIYDIAQKAGVSPATVSRVLNGSETVAKDLRRRVEKAMEESDYRPNRSARRMRSARASMWALIVPDLENPFFTQLARGVEDVSLRHNNFVMIGNSDFDTSREAAYINLAIEENVGGVVIAPAFPTSNIAPLLDAGVPTIVVNRRLDQPMVDTVISDNRMGGRMAATLMLKQGVKRALCIDGSPAGDRLAGFLDHFRDAAPSAEVATMLSDYRAPGGYGAMKKALQSANPPEAVFVTNNTMTLGVMHAIAETGLDVPDAISIVGFDVDERLIVRGPTITSVNQDPRLMGHIAADLLLKRIATPGMPAQTTLLSPSLVIGGTTRA